MAIPVAWPGGFLFGVRKKDSAGPETRSRDTRLRHTREVFFFFFFFLTWPLSAKSNVASSSFFLLLLRQPNSELIPRLDVTVMVDWA